METIIIDESAINAKPTVLAEQLVLALSVIVTFLMLGWIFWYSHYGIDLTDDSFYLVWISNPFNYSVSATQFGFIYHPLYELLDGNIAALRQANILITFGLSWALGNVLLKTVFGVQSLVSTHRLIVSASVATASMASLVFAGMWLPTPSYNSLAFQALLIAASGLLVAEKTCSRTSIAGWILIGIGGWLAFMAKPTTAAALGVTALAYLLLAGKLNIRLMMISLATAIGLLVLSALTINGSITGFIERIKDNIELATILGSGHTLAQSIRLDVFFLGEKEKDLLIAGMVAIFCATYFLHSKRKVLMYGGTILSVSFALASVAVILNLGFVVRLTSQFQGLLLWTVPSAVILLGFSIYRFKDVFIIPRSHWVLGLTFLMFPHAYAFGSSNNYWILAAGAGIFWVLAGLVLLGPLSVNPKLPVILLPLGLAVQVVTAVLVQNGIERPYRQPQPLRDNDYTLEIGRSGSMLVLAKGFGQYFSVAMDAARQAGFKKGTPMIDLSGRSPGILYAIGASNIGQAWTMGGYPGSDKLAIEMLNKVSCADLATAWLLVEPEGLGRISPEILLSFGANMALDFEVVGMFKTAPGAGSHKEARLQKIVKPTRSIDTAVTACVDTRATTQ